jgi:hypothetical protein
MPEPSPCLRRWFDEKLTNQLRHQRRGQGEVLQDEVLLNQRHPTPHLHNLPHHIRITDHPSIHPRRCILPIPSLNRVICFKDPLPPAVVDYHAELTNQIDCSNYGRKVSFRPSLLGVKALGTNTGIKVSIIIMLSSFRQPSVVSISRL